MANPGAAGGNTMGEVMSILGKIMGAIFGSGTASASPAQTGTAPAGSTGATTASPPPSGTAAGLGQAGANPTAAATADASTAAGQQQSSAAPISNVDVAKVLDDAVKSKGQQLNWRTSIVDLMKALDLDSSIGARKELAADLNFTGDTNDSAVMNTWLHKELMKKLAANGGKVPSDLAD
jgi:hypothetical protein